MPTTVEKFNYTTYGAGYLIPNPTLEPEEGKTWEAMKAHMYVISDAIAGALVKQFPAKF